MAKIIHEFETLYDRGDVVVFEKCDTLQVGIITAYYVDDNVVWYDIAVSKDFTYSYCNGGDIGEYDILGKIQDVELVSAIERMVKDGQS